MAQTRTKTFGRWKYLRRARLAEVEQFTGRTGGGRPAEWWLCRCQCGTVRPVVAWSLRGGYSKSCGCTRGGKGQPPRHGHAVRSGKSSEYRTWSAMKHWAKTHHVPLVRRWETFESFLADMGTRPKGRLLGRVRPGKGYSKTNCRWMTRSEFNSDTVLARLGQRRASR